MSLRKRMTTSPKLETEGVRFELDNARVILARAGGVNQKYNSLMSEWFKANKRALELDALSNDKAKADLIRFYAESIVLDWWTGFKEPLATEWNAGAPEKDGEYYWYKGIENADGTNVIAVTRESVIAFFTDVPDFFIECKQFAENGQYYRQALLDGVVGN